MKLFVDDLRNCPNQYIQAYNYEEAIKILENNKGNIDEISLDHDLGDVKSGYDICKWLVENEYWTMDKIIIHTANPVGAKNMFQLLDRYAPKNINIVRKC